MDHVSQNSFWRYPVDQKAFSLYICMKVSTQDCFLSVNKNFDFLKSNIKTTKINVKKKD